MKNYWFFSLLWIALLISPVNAQYESCQSCLDTNDEYLACVWVWLWDIGSCAYDYDNNIMNCEEGHSMCSQMCDSQFDEDWDEEAYDGCIAECGYSRDSCESDLTATYNQCVWSCQTNYCWSSCTSQWWWNEWWNEWWNWWSEWWNSTSSWSAIITSNQISWMWTALVQWWSWLLHIFIQLMPYAIAFTIIFLIFGLIKNWSKLRNKWLGDSYYAWSRVKRNYWFNVGQDEIDLLNFYEKDSWSFDWTWKYYRAKNWKVAYRYKYDWKWYTSYDSDEAIIDDILPDKEHHYKKRHWLYND